ncbi:MAG: PaaI family thioesterase [Thalassobaculum sp.]|uniref:PaaI family thioesterase n=1 Tax=Thalassobaculum sp. TaxID=2022740 RepID=UPI0032EFD5C1
MPLTVDEANARMLPFARLLGVRFTLVESDRVVAEMPVREDLCTRPAVAHGGALMAFADTVGAVATVANLRDGDGTTTIESKTNFLAAGPAGSTLVATATPVHRGGRTQVWQTRIETAEGKLVSLTTQTQMVLKAG